MGKLLPVALTAAMVLLAGGTSTAAGSSTEPTAEDLVTLDQPRPAWLTEELEAEVTAAGP
jgi:hypothetical protein